MSDPVFYTDSIRIGCEMTHALKNGPATVPDREFYNMIRGNNDENLKRFTMIDSVGSESGMERDPRVEYVLYSLEKNSIVASALPEFLPLLLADIALYIENTRKLWNEKRIASKLKAILHNSFICFTHIVEHMITDYFLWAKTLPKKIAKLNGLARYISKSPENACNMCNMNKRNFLYAMRSCESFTVDGMTPVDVRNTLNEYIIDFSVKNYDALVKFISPAIQAEFINFHNTYCNEFVIKEELYGILVEKFPIDRCMNILLSCKKTEGFPRDKLKDFVSGIQQKIHGYCFGASCSDWDKTFRYPSSIPDDDGNILYIDFVKKAML